MKQRMFATRWMLSALVALITFAAGCMDERTDLVRAGEVSLEVQNSEAVRFQWVRVWESDNAEGLPIYEVGGTLGGSSPNHRLSYGHVHAEIVDADGHMLASGFDRILAQRQAMRHQTRGHFRISLDEVPPGANIRLYYHPFPHEHARGGSETQAVPPGSVPRGSKMCVCCT